MGEYEVVVPYEDFKRMAAAEEKYTMLLDALLNICDLIGDNLFIDRSKLTTILMTFEPEECKNCIEWLKEKEARNG